MEIKKVRLHTCNQKIEGYIVDKCRCRKFVALEKAAELIDDGFANHVIISLKIIQVKEVCRICGGENKFKKRCGECFGSGEVLRSKIHTEIGEDIYRRPFLKTPRTATIEEEHIEYAYIKEDHDAQKRIELYHGLNQGSLAELGAALIDSKTRKVFLSGSPEPEDDAKKWRGRTYDWGRSI